MEYLQSKFSCLNSSFRPRFTQPSLHVPGDLFFTCLTELTDSAAPLGLVWSSLFLTKKQIKINQTF